MQYYQAIAKAIAKGLASTVKRSVENALGDGYEPADILENGLIAGMNEVSRRFKENEIFIPDVLLSSRAMHAGMHVLKPLLSFSDHKLPGKIVIGTVAGDLHDIGKNLVVMMCRGVGLEVIDLGIDVHPEEFLQAVFDHKPNILAMSALLTTTMPVMPETISVLVKAGMRDEVKVMVGGGPVTQEYARAIGADEYAHDARTAAEKALQLCCQ